MDTLNVRILANGYLADRRMPLIPADLPKVKACPERGRRIAAAYAELPSGGPANLMSHLSYQHFRLEIKDQFEWCQAFGLSFTPFGGGSQDPYSDSYSMMADVVNNGHLHVYIGDIDHPFLDSEDQFRFRAVHDVFGHAMGRNTFGPSGEENAWRCHYRMFSCDARSAMTAETRGQNSWFNFGPFGHLPAHDRPFAEQKSNILPLWCERV